jgi:hypothetical protein
MVYFDGRRTLATGQQHSTPVTDAPGQVATMPRIVSEAMLSLLLMGVALDAI